MALARIPSNVPLEHSSDQGFAVIGYYRVQKSCAVIYLRRIKFEQAKRVRKRGIILPTSIILAGEELSPACSCKALEIGPYVQGTRTREMLEICLAQHSDYRTLTHTFPLNASVIDCETRAIVQLREDMKYLA